MQWSKKNSFATQELYGSIYEQIGTDFEIIMVYFYVYFANKNVKATFANVTVVIQCAMKVHNPYTYRISVVNFKSWFNDDCLRSYTYLE